MIIWIIGMSASGKTAIGQELYRLIKVEHKNSIIIDGDIFRGLHGHDADYTIEGRKKNSDRITKMCHFLDQQDINVICCFLSIFPEAQQWSRNNYKNYFEIFLDVDFEILKQRDAEGSYRTRNLYKRALEGEINNVVGVDIEFKPPICPDLVIKNDGSESPAVIAH